MRRALPALAALFLLAACGQGQGPAEPAPDPIAPIDVAASDEKTDLTSPATGVAFWSHPNVAFYGLMIVSNADGVTSYNIEDRTEVSTIPGVNARGAAVSYFGKGPTADGVLAFYNTDTSAFEIHRIDNNTRVFSKITADFVLRGEVRGFCLGRSIVNDSPTLFIVQKGKLNIFNLTKELSDAGVETIYVDAPGMIPTPDNLVSCTVDHDGVVLLGSDKGDIYRLGDTVGLSAPFARAGVTQSSDIAIIDTTAPQGETGSYGQVALLDPTSANITLFNRDTGEALGAVRIAATDEIDAVDDATVMGASGANFGGLYRSGLIALGVDGDAPAIRVIPLNGVYNALGLEAGDPVDPRGVAPVSNDSDLIIDIDVAPELPSIEE